MVDVRRDPRVANEVGEMEELEIYTYEQGESLADLL